MEVHSSGRRSCVNKMERIFGDEIKKEEKMQIEKLPTLKLKYTLVVPFMGIVDALTMGSFFMNPATDGKLLIKAFYVICGVAGILFALWGTFCGRLRLMARRSSKPGNWKEKSGPVQI